MPTVQETVFRNSALQEIEEISAAPLALDDIWRGIEADQFLPHFQPKVNLRGMELAGVEALMRWQHPERGLLSPGAFLPVIADNFLFDELTAVMLEKSIAQSRRWQNDKVNVPVSVNLSPDLLRDTGIAERIEAKALRHGLPPHRLIIEVPEAAIAHDIAESLDNLVRLRVKGFGLAIDDFGTGHCDRNQLERIPASEMKIDRLMLAGAGQRPALKALLQQAIELARDLNLNSVAEGVESQEEWDLVNELGCDMAQGYFIARPMAGDDLLTWLHAWTSDPFV